jgi:hypothetical protein
VRESGFLEVARTACMCMKGLPGRLEAGSRSRSLWWLPRGGKKIKVQRVSSKDVIERHGLILEPDDRFGGVARSYRRRDVKIKKCAPALHPFRRLVLSAFLHGAGKTTNPGCNHSSTRQYEGGRPGGIFKKQTTRCRRIIRGEKTMYIIENVSVGRCIHCPLT